MESSNLCKPWEHALTRRQLLGSLAACGLGMGGLGGLVQPAFAEKMRKNNRQVLFVWLDGGMSQLESWDPKPNTQFGGPYRPIATSVPGTQISELMPNIARHVDKLAIVRSMKTADNSHSSGVPRILRGDPKNRGVTYPYFGSAVAKLLGPGDSGLPPYIWIKPGSGGFKPKFAGFLGAKYGPLAFGDGKPPTNFVRPAEINDEADQARNELREFFNQRYAEKHRKSNSEAHSYVYDVARELMKHRDVFDESTYPTKDVDRYGRNEFGRHMLIARRMLEVGVRFVQVTSYGWDTHGDNFNGHASRVPKVDTAFSAMLEDLEDRGMLDNVLVVLMSEFGRTPRINGSVGRDHWPNAWSLAMAGTGIKRGVVVGKTNELGTDVATQPLDIGALFHTWFTALGLNSHEAEYMNGRQPLPVAHDEMEPVQEVLA